MPIPTTTIGAYPKPDYIPIPDGTKKPVISSIQVSGAKLNVSAIICNLEVLEFLRYPKHIIIYFDKRRINDHGKIYSPTATIKVASDSA